MRRTILGLRVISGLVLSDHGLPPSLCQTPEIALSNSRLLIENFRESARLQYAVIPRFAPLASEAMLEVCQTLLRENPGLTFTTHINESQAEIVQVLQAFPWAADYLAIYEKYDLVGPRSVLSITYMERTRNWFVSLNDRQPSRIARAAMRRSATASFLCSATSMRTCELAGERCGSRDGIRHSQRGAPGGADAARGWGPVVLTSAQLLWLATRAGAEAISMADEIGDFTPGKAAIWFTSSRPPVRRCTQCSPYRRSRAHAQRGDYPGGGGERLRSAGGGRCGLRGSP